MFMELTYTSIVWVEKMVTVDLSNFLPTIGSFSGAGAVGALLGYGFKKLLKVLLIVLAAFTALIGIPLGYLAYEGVITINWDRLYALLDSAASASISWFSTAAQAVAIAVPAFGGFVAGFAVGFQKG
jgi:uncharacterized membrane protein (Fun14 family)